MKTLKKLAALTLAFAMMMALVINANAATIFVNPEAAKFAANHTYKVYQIYTGTLSGGELSNVKYGADFGRTGSPVPKSELDAIGSDGRAFANRLMASDGALLKDVDSPFKTLNQTNGFKVENVPDGYYLIVDTASPLSDGDILSQYMIKVLGTTEIVPKKDLPSSEKKIISDGHTEDSPENPGLKSDGKVDNVSIGDTVTFQITNKVPANASTYDYFYFIINDTLSEGLSLVPSDGSGIVVTASSDGDLTNNTDYKVYTGDAAEGHTFQVALLDAKGLAGQTITVTYSAVLNENAVIGSDGNLNTESLTYSNNPNEDYDGSRDENNPGKPKTDSTVPLGETPDSTTQTFTSGIKIQKLDQDMMALAGAGFTISGESINKVVRNVEVFEENATGEYWKLTSGSYTKDAPQSQEYMKAQACEKGEGYIVAPAGYTAQSGDKVINGVIYIVPDANTAGTHVLMMPNTSLYDDVNTKYAKTTTQVVEDTTEQVSQTLMVNSDGTLNLKGLGAGTYTIHESVVPAGYTAAKDVTVVITFDNATKEFTATVNGTTVSADSTTNLFPVDIQNIAGNELPETGGIGTKIFYALGAVLVVGAGVVLVSRKRALD